MYKLLISFFVAMCIASQVCYAVSAEAESSVVMEADTRQVIFYDNADNRQGIASTTKIMTAVLALENGSLDDIITVSENAQNQEGSSIYIRKNDKISLEDLLYGLMLNSGNDAAVAIAEAIGGDVDTFVKMMNDKAVELGCKNTHFVNPNGLSDPEHYSTAYDMALIMSYAVENEDFCKITSTKEYQIKMPSSVTYLRNHNKLLWRYEGCISGKTGFTKATGRCLVSCAQKDGIKLVAVTLNDRNDWTDHENMYDHAFKKVKNTKIISENDIICTKKIQGVNVNLLANEDFYAPALTGKKQKLSCRIDLTEDISGEINVGTPIGYADIFAGKYNIGRIKLTSGQNIKKEQKNIFFSNINYILKAFLLK